MENTTLTHTSVDIDRRVWQALTVWGIFIVLLVIINATIPFALGVNVHAWTYSKTKGLLFDSIIYAGLFLAVPLILTKGMSNPEYWYSHLSFVFVAIAVTSAIYIWRRSLIVTWLGDGTSNDRGSGS